MMEFAYGVMGLTPEQLAGLTPFAFNQKCEGYAKKREMETENFRMLAYITYKMNAGKNDNKSMDDIWPTAQTAKRREEKNRLMAKNKKKLLIAYKKRKGIL